jgi:hypothetical protein
MQDGCVADLVIVFAMTDPARGYHIPYRSLTGLVNAGGDPALSFAGPVSEELRWSQ